MDSLDDDEIESIWDRIKAYVPVDELDARTPADFEKRLKPFLKEPESARDSRGSMETLLRKGFAKRAIEVSSIKKEFLQGLPPRVKEVFSGRYTAHKAPINNYAVRTETRTKIFSQKNIHIADGKWKGKEAYWVYNTKTHRIVTWGLYRVEIDLEAT